MTDTVEATKPNMETVSALAPDETERLGGEPFIDLVIEHTHSCYLGDREHRHAWGWGCGLCPSCDLRRKGYDAWLVS